MKNSVLKAAAVVILLGSVVAVLAETINNQMFSTRYGTAVFQGNSTTANATLSVDDVVVGDTLSVASTLEVALLSADALRDNSLSTARLAVASGSYQLAGVVNRFYSMGAATNGTNTITFANLPSGTAGNMYLVINTGTTNHLRVAQSGTWKSPALLLDEGGAAWVVAVSSNALYGGSDGMLTVAAGSINSSSIEDNSIVTADVRQQVALTVGALTTTGAVTISEGMLANSTIVSADIKDGVILGADIRTNTIGKANLAAADFGDFTVGSDGTCTLDASTITSAKISNGVILGEDVRTNTIGKANLAAADFGDFTVGSDGTCTLDASTITSAKISNGVILGEDVRTNTIGKANLAAADFGDFTVGSDGTCTLDASTITSAKISNGVILGEDIRTNTVGKANLAAADFGDFTVGANGTCTVDSGAITQAKMNGVVKNSTATTTDLKVYYGTCTNGQVVTWGSVFTAVVMTQIEGYASATNNHFTSINTTNGTAVVHPLATAIRYMVIGR